MENDNTLCPTETWRKPHPPKLKSLQNLTFLYTYLQGKYINFILTEQKTVNFYLFFTNKKGRLLMGAILELVEKLKEPTGMVVALVIIGAVYFFAKWVFAEHPDDV